MFSHYGIKLGLQTAHRALIFNKSLPLRRLKLLEYKSIGLLDKYSIPVPLGGVTKDVSEALWIARILDDMGTDM
jgi:hypothetical protein